MDLCRAANAGGEQSGGFAKVGCCARRSCRGLDAERARGADHILCNQLSRCRLRAFQHCLSRRDPRACAGQLGCHFADCPCRAARSAGGDRYGCYFADRRARRARWKSRVRSSRFPWDQRWRSRSCSVAKPDRAVGYPVDHLHLGHHRPVQGRSIFLPSSVHQCRA